MPNRKLTAEEHKLYLMRTAKTVATDKFTSIGKRREIKPITLPALPWENKPRWRCTDCDDIFRSDKLTRCPMCGGARVIEA
jgi:hypothetical protein